MSTCDEFENALHGPAGRGLTWMDSAGEKDDWFIEVLFRLVQVFFGKDDSIGIFAYFLFLFADAIV